MKHKFLLMVIFLLTMGNMVYAQKVTLDFRQEKLGKVMEAISKQTGKSFSYSRPVINPDAKVSISVKDEELYTALARIIETGNVEIEITDKKIFLKPIQKRTSPISTGEQKQLTGHVSDASGEAVIGASVGLKGGNNLTVSDVDGRFSISAPVGSVLVISHIGYLPQEVTVGNRSDLTIILPENTELIDEVVVVGYGTNSKRKMTSAISTVPIEKIENRPSMSAINNLGGTTPGIIVTQSAGGPDQFASISIRGGGTPIVVLDGVVVGYDYFKYMNPLDIENISILKDAAAAAVYGARAGNGILLVTSKQGSNKPLSINYTGNYSLSQPSVLQEKLNSYDVAFYRNVGYENDGYGPNYMYTPEVMEKYRTGSDPFNYPNTDWYKVAMHNFATETSHNLSLNGGDKRNGYYASLGYYDQGSILTYRVGNTKRYNARLNMMNSFENIGLKTTTGVSFNTYNYHELPTGVHEIFRQISLLPPMSLARTDLGYFATGMNNLLPYLTPDGGYQDYNNYFVNGLFNAEWEVPHVEGFVLKSISNYSIDSHNDKRWTNVPVPRYDIGSDTPVPNSQKPVLNELYFRRDAFTQQFLADYTRGFDNGFTLGALLGYEFSKESYSDITAGRSGYTIMTDQFLAGPTIDMTNNAWESEAGRAAYLGRLKVDYKAKYLLEASFRRDGSDWFPKDKRWGTFYSFSGAWALSEESFMAGLKESETINLLKVRGSYGLVGLSGADAGLSRFAYVPGYNLNTDVYVMNGALQSGFTEGNLVSPDISWYTLASSNVGVDFSGIKNSVFGSLEYFYYRTDGYLASPSNVGYTAPLGKSLPVAKSDGALRRAGYEASLGYRNRIGDLQYEVSGNFTYFDQLWEMNPYESEVTTKNPNKRNMHVTNYYTIGYKNLGYYTNMEDVLNSPKRLESHNLRPGDIKYADINGDGIIDGNDQVRIGKPTTPRINYGINIDLKYGGFFLNALFMGSGNRHVYLYEAVRGNSIQTSGAWVVYPYQTDFWTESNPNALYPRTLSSPSYNGENNYPTSDFWMINGRYFRLKSLQFGYDFKDRILKQVKFLTSAKVVLSGNNLLTWSNTLKHDIDPESDPSNQGYPIQRMYSVSLNLGF